ncbi:MAG: hypothetical protein J7M17_09150 [Anaerolineae bacterium]|nr:hypothetical protein [Anaerolineae bacterium]
MRFRYSTTDPTQSELDSLPRLPLVLRHGQQIVHAVGLKESTIKPATSTPEIA